MTDDLYDLIALAAKIAKRSPNKMQHGALVLDRKHKVLAYGNNYKFTHAEIAALRKIPERARQGTIIISVRLTQGGHDVSNARPCSACQKALKKYGVREVFYTTTDRTVERMLITI